MKNKNLILFIAAFLSLSVIYAQEKTFSSYEKAIENINKYGEVYFTFQLVNFQDVKLISQLVSVDKIEKLKNAITVYAYANSKQFEKFKELQIKYVVNTPPSLLFEAKMANTSKEMNEWDTYPTYEAYVQMMVDFANNYPELCKLDTIGISVENRLILAIKISDNVNEDEAEPEFYYTSSMHGDEITGYVLMLRLIDYLLSNYNSIAEIKDLVDNTEIWINPSANPDGTYAGGNSTVNGATRYNAKC
ncbi:MAG: hypothetical protein GXO79_12685 [Chlorobi bacterium]|nr:hypothetical protein [Chlorobiota bacterium]